MKNTEKILKIAVEVNAISNVGGRQYDYARDKYNHALSRAHPTAEHVADAERWLAMTMRAV